MYFVSIGAGGGGGTACIAASSFGSGNSAGGGRYCGGCGRYTGVGSVIPSMWVWHPKSRPNHDRLGFSSTGIAGTGATGGGAGIGGALRITVPVKPPVEFTTVPGATLGAGGIATTTALRAACSAW